MSRPLLISDQCQHPVLQLLRQRQVGEGDPHTLALVVEGGGMAGTVSAGMCVLLEQLGLTQHFDLIVGSSAGSLNGSYLACGQATLGSTNYLDSAHRGFLNPLRLLQGRPVINMPFLFEQVMDQKPYRLEQLSPRLVCLATALGPEPQLVRLEHFQDETELRHAVQASCQMPGLSGPPLEIGGQQLIDGGLLESIPYPSALELGATHVLVLRSYSAQHRKGSYGWLARRYLRSSCPQAEPLVQARPERYNRQAAELLQPNQHVCQIAPTRDLCTTFETRPQRLRGALTGGAQAAASALGLGSVKLRWQPLLEQVASPSDEERR